MSLNDKIDSKISRINDYLNQYIYDNESYQTKIFDAMKYSVFAGGKRLRPILMMLSYELLAGKAVDTIMPFACALEMIHTYSLIHDDLPAMDDDDYRRGKLTNHKVFGEDMAILAGDGLLNLAYETMINGAIASQNPNALKAMQVIARASGVYGMVAGQVVDLESEHKRVDKQTLEFIHQNKTAALLQAPLMAGAILAAATHEQVSLLERAGYSLGMAFQIQDDILDVIGDEQTLGKATNSDIKNEKSTFVSLYGLEHSKKCVQNYSKQAEEIFESFGDSGAFLVELTKDLVKRNY